MDIYIGYDPKESVAFHVLAHSIIRRSSVPVTITPLWRPLLKDVFTRERGPYDSTDFSISRFMVPYLSKYRGMSLYLDCDMLCLADVAELQQYHTLAPVSVCQHDYTPKSDVKMDNQIQTKYPKKNWSSLMLFNNAGCEYRLKADYVNTAPGLDLHQFTWTDRVQPVPLEWNWLVGEYPTNYNAKILHYTLGDWQAHQEWHDELNHMLHG